LVFSEVYYPKGWTLTLDDGGRTLEIKPEGKVLRAAEVPAGEHTLTMRFNPPSYRTGETVSRACSIIILLVVLLAAGFAAVPKLLESKR
jgi:uncharacterized membrane protein YfhO